MAEIRAYQPKDLERLRMICLATGPQQAEHDARTRTMLLATYCDYYAQCEGHNCFVLADDADEAVGYILCAENYKQYRARFLREYAPRVKGLRWAGESYAAALLPMVFQKQYPAHLHIDILPDYQRRGFGTQLMDTLTSHLRAKGVPGVQLGVGSGNSSGIRFYKAYGFRKLARVPACVLMGLVLEH